LRSWRRRPASKASTRWYRHHDALDDSPGRRFEPDRPRAWRHLLILAIAVASGLGVVGLMLHVVAPMLHWIQP